MPILIGRFPYYSQLAFALLSTAPAFLQPKSIWNIWDLSDFLSSRMAQSSTVTLDHPVINWPTCLPKLEQHWISLDSSE